MDRYIISNNCHCYLVNKRAQVHRRITPRTDGCELR